MGRTLKDLINDSCKRYPDRPAVRTLQPVAGQRRGVAEYTPISYGEMDAQRLRLAAGLAGLGMSKGQRIGILTDGGLEPLLVGFDAWCCPTLYKGGAGATGGGSSKWARLGEPGP